MNDSKLIFVEGLPVIIQFDVSDYVTIEGGQINERWTTTGTLFARVDKI